MNETLYLGLKSNVIAIDKRTGVIVWRTELSNSWLGDPFVSIFCDGQNIYAHTKRTLYCVSPTDGQILWETSLKDFGYGIPTFASSDPSSANLAAIVRQMNQSNDTPPANS